MVGAFRGRARFLILVGLLLIPALFASPFLERGPVGSLSRNYSPMSFSEVQPLYTIDVGMPKEPLFLFDGVFEGGMLINPDDLIAAGVAATLVATLALLFQYTKVGRALSAVADDHQAAQSVGIPLGRIWVVVWAVAGIVALVAGQTLG